jgi:hypothetical protein
MQYQPTNRELRRRWSQSTSRLYLCPSGLKCDSTKSAETCRLIKPVMTTLIMIFRVESIRRLIVDYLRHPDICALIRSTKLFHAITESLWRCKLRTEETAWSIIVRDVYLAQNVCDSRYRVRYRSYRCLNSPVVKVTICMVCGESKRRCSTCIERSFHQHMMCDFCTFRPGVCEDCYDVGMFELHRFLNTMCIRCNRVGCSDHFHNEICNKCYKKRRRLK